MNTHQILKKRYATQKFDIKKTVSSDDIDYIIEAGNLAPTSYGLQPISFVVVTDPDIKESLVKHAYGQTNISENSALIVLCARTDINTEMIDEYTARVETVRGMQQGALEGFKNMVIADLTNRPEDALLHWAQKQCYISLMAMMIAAAEKGIDSCPMEGFSPSAFNDVLSLSERNLSAAVILTVGYRSEEDVSSEYKKVRRAISDIRIDY